MKSAFLRTLLSTLDFLNPTDGCPGKEVIGSMGYSHLLINGGLYLYLVNGSNLEI